jgi:hypothetical protein
MIKPIANAIDWWLNEQGKKGVVRTAYENCQYVLTAWTVAGVAQPTEAELVSIVSAYETELVNAKNIRLSIKNKLKNALGLTAQEMKYLLGFLRGEE